MHAFWQRVRRQQQQVRTMYHSKCVLGELMVGRNVRRLSDCCRTLRALVCHPDCQTAVGHCRYTVGHCRTPSDTVGHCRTVGLLSNYGNLLLTLFISLPPPGPPCIFAIPRFTIWPSFLMSRYHKIWVYQPLGLSSPSLRDATYPLPPRRKTLAPYPPTPLLPRAKREPLHRLAYPNPS